MSAATDAPSSGRRGILFVVSAPSGAGKTTLVKAALDADTGLSLSVSCTTRTPRTGEQDGRDYFFVDQAEFARRRDGGDFVEWAQVFDHFYATPRGPLDGAIAQGRDVLLDVDIQGARAITKTYPADAVGIFVVPPSFAVLEQRLRARGTDSIAQIKRRLDRVREELAAGRDTNVYDYLVVNEDRDRAVRDLLAVIGAERCRIGRCAAVQLD
ncbi:MAG: guanylate kinase [Deltaproteobacteria bacterium]|nr:guanylate kinase [Deltaproteobacteria bacterium]